MSAICRIRVHRIEHREERLRRLAEVDQRRLDRGRPLPRNRDDADVRRILDRVDAGAVVWVDGVRADVHGVVDGRQRIVAVDVELVLRGLCQPVRQHVPRAAQARGAGHGGRSAVVAVSWTRISQDAPSGRPSDSRGGTVDRANDRLEILAVPRVHREVAERLGLDHLGVARRHRRIGMAIEIDGRAGIRATGRRCGSSASRCRSRPPGPG